MSFSRSRTLPALVVTAVAALTVSLAPGAASAGTQTKWYSVTTDASTVSVAGGPVAFTLANCGTALACPRPSSQPIASFDIDLPAQWTATLSGVLPQPSGWIITVAAGGAVVQVRSAGAVVAPGTAVTIPLTVRPVASDAGQTRTIVVPAKQSNDFSGTGNDFVLVGAPAQLTVRALHLQFTQQPHNVQVTTASGAQPMCPAVTVQLRDEAVGGSDVALAGVSVSLTSATPADPLLTLGAAAPSSTSVTVATNATGAAVFSSSATGCAGLRAWHSGGPYSLNASSTGIATVSSGAFSVYDYYQPCPATGACTTPSGGIVGGSGTQGDVSATGAATLYLGVSVLPSVGAGSSCGDTLIAARPEAVQLDLAAGDKTLTLTWTKADTLRDPRNGTPFWPVCMTADHAFVTANGTTAANDPATTGWFSGLLPACGAAGVPAGNPCMTLSRKQAREIAAVHLPASWGGDPYFH
ncbi:MAG: hypothetical protein QOI42_1398 [Frankiaceae bacterium]|nr:hypothetical protein [Frankiaceae bacterium]